MPRKFFANQEAALENRSTTHDHNGMNGKTVSWSTSYALMSARVWLPLFVHLIVPRHSVNRLTNLLDGIPVPQPFQ